jgi:hypothetical protein
MESRPSRQNEAAAYINTAIAWRDADTAVPFAIVRLSDRVIIGSPRFWNIEYCAWPAQHAFHGRGTPDACKIGYTWFTQSVCFHTDSRNQRSRAALERIGAKYDAPRAPLGGRFHSARFSLLNPRRRMARRPRRGCANTCISRKIFRQAFWACLLRNVGTSRSSAGTSWATSRTFCWTW